MQYVSINNIVSTVIRRLGAGNIQTSYYDDIVQYIVDAFRLMEVTTTAFKKSAIVKICDNMGELPCDFHEIEFVSYCGVRVPLGGDQSDIPNQKSLLGHLEVPRDNTLPVYAPNGDNIYTNDTEYKAVVSRLRTTYYRIQGKYIQTNLDKGEFDIAYWAIPVDESNYPLMPDKQSFVEACSWFAIRNLIGSGYNHPVFNYQYADAQWMQWEAKAVGDLREFTPEHAERLIHLNTLVPPDWNKSFFINAEKRIE